MPRRSSPKPPLPCQASRGPPHDGKCQIDDAPRDPTRFHQEPREDEKRHGHEREEIDTGVHALHDQHQRDVAFEQERSEASPSAKAMGMPPGRRLPGRWPALPSGVPAFGLGSRCASGTNVAYVRWRVVEHE